MSDIPAGHDLDQLEKAWKIVNLQADTALKQQEKAWKIVNLQADTALKQEQGKYEAVKVLVAGLASGGALVAGTIAVMRLLGG